jgi:stage V sporulation protein B
LNQRTLRQRIPGIRIFEKRKWGRLVLACLFIVVIGSGVEAVIHHAFMGWPRFLRSFAQTVIVCGLVGALFPVMLGMTRVVTREDVKTYPASVQRLLGKIGRLAGRRL